jgi:hypothetical protein
MISVTTIPILAAGKEDAIIAVIVFVITVVSWITKLAGNRNPKAPPVTSRPRPQKPRDDKLKQEISIFLEEASGRRKPAAGQRGPAQPQKQPQGKRRTSQTADNSSRRRTRPGEELSSRQSPVSDSLGTGVKQHTRELSDRVSQEMQQRLAPRVEQQVATDLGPAVAGAPVPAAVPVGGPAVSSRAEKIAAMLRSPAGVQQAIVMNLILSPPPGRTRATRTGGV